MSENCVCTVHDNRFGCTLCVLFTRINVINKLSFFLLVSCSKHALKLAALIPHGLFNRHQLKNTQTTLGFTLHFFPFCLFIAVFRLSFAQDRRVEIAKYRMLQQKKKKKESKYHRKGENCECSMPHEQWTQIKNVVNTTGKKCVFIHRNRDEIRNEMKHTKR